MVARLCFDPDGEPINQRKPTKSELIRFHRVQINWLEGITPAADQKQSHLALLARHRAALDRLLADTCGDGPG